MNRARQHLPAVLIYILLIFSVYAGIALYEQAPSDLITLSNLEITLKKGQQVTIGGEELLQRASAGSAEKAHLRIRRDRDGNWFISNVAQSRKVEIETSRKDARYLKRWPISKGDTLDIDRQIFKVLQVDGVEEKIVLLHEQSNKKIVWDGNFDQESSIHCSDVLKPWWLRRLRSSDEYKVFSLGGKHLCRDRYPLKGVAYQSAWIYWGDDQFWIGPGLYANKVYIVPKGRKKTTTLEEIWTPIDGSEGKLKSMILGRTTYITTWENDNLKLRPLGIKDFWERRVLQQKPCVLRGDDDNLRCTAGPGYFKQNLQKVRWMGYGLSLTDWVLHHYFVTGIAIILAIGLTAVLVHYQKQQDQILSKSLYEIAIVIPVIYIGIFFFAFYLLGNGPDLSLKLILLFLTWLWATIILHWSGRLSAMSGLIWLAATGLAIIGSFTLVQMGVGAENSKWLIYPNKHLMLLTLFAGVVILFNAIPVDVSKHWLQEMASSRQRFWVIFRFAVPIGLVAILVLQGMFGTEKGVMGVQPIELAKFVIILMAGIIGGRIIELRRVGTLAYRENPVYFFASTTATAIMFIVFAVAIMLAVRDFSPFLIVFTFMAAMLWRLARHPENYNPHIMYIIRAAIATPVVIGLAVAIWIYYELPSIVEMLPQHERFLVWADPYAYPHTGAQLLAALDYVRLGEWWGSGKEMFGFNGRVITVPAIHNDFIGAFLLYKFGGVTGLALLASQLLLLLILWMLSLRFQVLSVGKDFRQREAYQVFSIVLFGIAWMFAVHWFISWGNILGLLPVMGQPMTWVSAANSHLLFFALPSLYFALVLSWLHYQD